MTTQNHRHTRCFIKADQLPIEGLSTLTNPRIQMHGRASRSGTRNVRS